MKVFGRMPPILCLLPLLCACGAGPDVLQGEVVRYQSEAKTIAIRDELPPHREVSLSLEKAEMGGEPHVGDKVRVAYRETEGRPMVIRLMNLTHHQELAEPSK